MHTHTRTISLEMEMMEKGGNIAFFLYAPENYLWILNLVFIAEKVEVFLMVQINICFTY